MSLRGRLRMPTADVAWLTGQGVLFLLAFVVLPSAAGGPGRLQLPGARRVGSGVFALGAVLALLSFRALGRQLVPQPTPIEDGELVDRGPYGVVRHPIYTAVLMMVLGSLARTPSLAGALVVAAGGVFFDRKSAYEERLLVDRHPAYVAYRQRVRWKLIPGVR